jgi:hypothetical protein
VDEEIEISRWLINLKIWKLTGAKRHDYHIIMEWHLQNMLQGYVHQDVWKTLVELNYFYRQLCAKEIKKEMMEKLDIDDHKEHASIMFHFNARKVFSDAL